MARRPSLRGYTLEPASLLRLLLKLLQTFESRSTSPAADTPERGNILPQSHDPPMLRSHIMVPLPSHYTQSLSICMHGPKNQFLGLLTDARLVASRADSCHICNPGCVQYVRLRSTATKESLTTVSSPTEVDHSRLSTCFNRLHTLQWPSALIQLVSSVPPEHQRSGDQSTSIVNWQNAWSRRCHCPFLHNPQG